MNIPKDKIYHFCAGFLLCVIFTLVNDPITGIGASICGGIMKECYDEFQKDGSFDAKDMIATWLGGFVGFLITTALEKL